MEKRIENLKMYPFNTTLMGVLKGVFDYYDISLSDAWLFGGSGHAFLINIHEQLCPSGPYCWNPKTFYELLRNLGIEMKDLGFLHRGSNPEEIKHVEEVLKKYIDENVACSFLNMENQLIFGYNDKQFLVRQPWPKDDLPITPKTLTFHTWKDLGDEVHINFYSFAKIEKAEDETIIRHSLSYAADMVREPKRWRQEHYYIGLEAYDAWIQAVRDRFGSSHGNWWNGTVWSECREMASKYFVEIASKYKGSISEKAMNLSRQYKGIAELLHKASDKKLADDEKIKTLLSSREAEESCINEIEEFLHLF